MVTLIAPMPIAAAGTSGSLGRWNMATPPTGTMNLAGNTGPPRKLLCDTL